MTSLSATPPSGVAPKSSRVARKRDRKIRDILMAAASVLNESGYHAMSMDDVASRLDLTKATLYHYFSSKDDLVAASLSTVASEVNDRLQTIARSGEYDSAGRRLRELLMAQLTILLKDYPEAGHLFVQTVELPVALAELMRSLRKAHDDVFRRVIEDGVRSGEFRDVDVRTVRQCIHGAINYVPVWTHGMSMETSMKSARSVVDHLMRMLEPAS